MLSSHPHSLLVKDRTEKSGDPGPSTLSRNGQVQVLRDSREYKVAIEKELEAWMDVLMESDSVDRRTLKRASLYLGPYDYEQVEHERHLASTCSYPLCANRSFRPFNSDPHYTFRSTGVISALQSSRNRDLVSQEEGNKDDGFCKKDCLIRSRWFGRGLRDEAVWTRAEISPGDWGRWKSRARGSQNMEEIKRKQEVELLEEMEERGEVLLKNGNLYLPGSFPPDEPDRTKPSHPVENPATPPRPTHASKAVRELEKSGIVAETRTHPSRFENQLEATLAGLKIVEREVKAGPVDPPTPGPIQRQEEREREEEQRTEKRMQPVSDRELLPISDTPMQGVGKKEPSANPEWQGDYEEEDEETRAAFEIALAAREMLRNGSFE